ncbi:MAG: hypothetical protein ACRCZS_02340 [Chroococcidiopsis sp.]
MHPIYSQSALEVLSTAQVKDIAQSIGAIPDGDKRSKQPWIDAIIAHQAAFSPIKVAAMEAHIEAVDSRLDEEEFIASQVLAEDDTLDLDAWVAPEMPSHAEKVLNCKSNKKGAIAIVAILLVAIGIVIRSILIGGCAIVRYTILLGSMFGEYNPDLDLWYRLKSKHFAPAT